MQTEQQKPNSTENKRKKKANIVPEEPRYGLNATDWMFLIFFFVITGLSIYLSFVLLSITDDAVKLGTSRYSSLLIFILLFFGLSKGYSYLKTIAIENGIVSHILSMIKNKNSIVTEKTIAPPGFKELYRIIPFPTIKKESICRKMMTRIIRDAEDYIYDQREAVVRPYKEELSDSLILFSSLQTTALRVGILGTFVGLIIAIVNLGGIQDIFSVAKLDKTELFAKFSGELFTSLHIAFGTSVVGLVVAILLSFFSIYLKTQQKILFSKMDESASEMMSLARRATYNDEGLFSSFAQMKSAMDNLELRIHDEHQGTIRSVEVLGDRLVEQTKLIDNGIVVASEAQQNWQNFLNGIETQQTEVFQQSIQQRNKLEKSYEGFLDKLNDREESFIKDLSKAFDFLSVDKLGKSIFDNIAQTGQQIENSINLYMQNVTSQITSAGKDIKNIINSDITKLSRQVETAGNSNEALNNSLVSILGNIQDISSQLEKSNKNIITFDQLQKNLETTLEHVQSAQLSFQKEIQESIERLHSIPLDTRLEDKIAIATDKNLSPVNETMKQLLSEIETLNKTGTIIRKGANYLDRIFTNRFFKFTYILAFTISIIIGIIAVVMAILGLITFITAL
jgi:hypothetical protein